MHPKQRKLKGRQHPTFIREHAYVLLAAAFSLVNALFLSHFLGYFSTFLVYLPLVVFCVPARTAFDVLLWKDWNNGYYRKTAFAIWTVYLLLFGIHLRTPTVPATKPGATYFIAANLYNSEAVLPSWTREMHHLITYLGESNVFVSIYESNSIDNTPALLKVFREELDARSVLNKIVLDKRERGHWGLNSPARIAFMAEIRNKVLDPLKETERAYSKVIFFNDVFFDWRDVSLLINTKEGDYDLACAMDFDGIGLYDIWVTRDACGRPTKEIWPYFSTDSRAVRSLKRNEPIEVASCWNGIAVFDASWFLPSDFNVTKPSSAHPTQTGDFVPPLPLQFRGSTDCVSSECFIVSMDLHFWNSPQRPKIYINPRVKVAYEKLNYIFHVQLEQLGLAWPWRLVWQDWIGWKLFGWVSDAIWLKEDKCQRNWEGFIKPNWC